MPKNKTIISKKSLKKIFLDEKAERISDSALKVFVELLERKADEIAKIAEKLARHSNRTTILKKDIKLACEKIFHNK